MNCAIALFRSGMPRHPPDLTPQLRDHFHSLDGKDLCCVAIQPSSLPVFIKDGIDEDLYIRTGNSTRHLTTEEAIEYVKSRWKTA